MCFKPVVINFFYNKSSKYEWSTQIHDVSSDLKSNCQYFQILEMVTIKTRHAI